MTVHQRQFSAALQTHLDGSGTTLCYLLKLTLTDGTVVGVTSLDQDITYNDSEDTVTYNASIGQDQSSTHNTSKLDVDNSEAVFLLADTGVFTQPQIDAGVLDYAQYDLYRVNWQDLSQGHIIVSTGRTGAVKQRDSVSGVVELRGLAQQLKQSFVELYSLTCRARFGGGSYPDDRFPCGFDATTLWQNHSVSIVDVTETDRVFTANSAPTVSGPGGPLEFVPGLVEWLTGDNAGLSIETENVNAANIALRYGTPWDIQVGDTFKIRPDCDKTWDQCKNLYQNEANFRGEPLIPVGDEASSQTPGAAGYPIFPGAGNTNLA